MSRLISAATGNWTDSSATWALVDNTSYADSATTLGTALATTAAYSATFTPGAITVDGIAVKIGALGGTTGTMTIQLVKNSDNSVIGAQTINLSDIANTSANGTYDRGWYFFAFSGGAVTLLGATAYKVNAIKSVGASTIQIYATAASTDWLRMLRTTTTSQAPGVGDQVHIIGKWTGTNALTSYTITMDNTATTSFGPTVSGGPAQGLTIGKGGTMTCGTAHGVNYYLKFKGAFTVYDAGTLNIGTSVTPVPSDSTAVFEMDSVATVDTGFEFTNGSTVNIYGASKTTVKTLMTLDRGGFCSTVTTAVTGLASQAQSFVGLSGTIVINGSSFTISSVTDATHLTLTGSAGSNTNVKWTHAGTANVVTVASTSGWAANDTLCFAATTQTASECESAIIQSVDSATQVTLTTALTKVHQGVSPVQAEVGNLTRNVKLRGVSSSLFGYLNLAALCTFNSQYAEYYQLGSATANKRGIDVAVTTGAFNMQYCTIHDGTNTSCRGLNLAAGSGNNYTFSNNIIYNVNAEHMVVVATSQVHTFDSNLFMLSPNTSTSSLQGMLVFNDVGCTFTNNTIVGCSTSGNAWALGEGTNTPLGTISGNTVHSCTGQHIVPVSTGQAGGTISSCNFWRCSPSGGNSISNSCRNWTFDSCNFFGNNGQNYFILAVHFNCTFYNCTFNSDSAFTNSNTGITIQNGAENLRFLNCSFSAVSGIKTSLATDINLSSAAQTTGGAIELNNTLLGGANEFGNLTTFPDLANDKAMMVGSEKHDQTSGNHKTFKPMGNITIDTTIFDTSPSMRLTPNTASAKLTSIGLYGGFKALVASGSTVTFSIKIRKSVIGDGAAYNGNQPRLFLKANGALGVNADTLLNSATNAANGAWETVSGTTAAATEDGVFEFYVDCDGTTGWVNFDTISIS